MSHEIPQQSGEGSMDGRPWSCAELFTFIGFLNDEKNDGALQNTTMKFASPTLRKASGIMTERFPQRRWNFDSNIRQQFTRLRDDWRIFKDILDASGTEWNDEARSFELSKAQRASFIHKHGARANRIIDWARQDPSSSTEDTRNNSNAPHSIATNPTQLRAVFVTRDSLEHAV
ncbi:hypothetical protein E4U16_007974 [Claviceps sp. LM84 group G4]|nr:hypothetical protein E4U16_007974 [Claviceps sp. LM84 group G4]